MLDIPFGQLRLFLRFLITVVILFQNVLETQISIGFCGERLGGVTLYDLASFLPKWTNLLIVTDSCQCSSIP